MAPESVSTLIALDLEWNGSRLEGQVNRYSMVNADKSFMYVSWDATECPQNYKPIRDSGAYVWLPQVTIHNAYRAKISGNGKDGYRWRDHAGGNGAMIILTLPPDHVFTHPNADYRFPVDFKYSNDGRMSLYWWINPDRFTLRWHMKSDPNLDMEEQCDLLSDEAWDKYEDDEDLERPPHIDGLNTNNPSSEPKVDNNPPEWHEDIALPSRGIFLHLLVQHFSDDELKTLCFTLDFVEYDDLGGEGRAGKARELIAISERKGKFEDLINRCAKERPNADWFGEND